MSLSFVITLLQTLHPAIFDVLLCFVLMTTVCLTFSLWMFGPTKLFSMGWLDLYTGKGDERVKIHISAKRSTKLMLTP